MAIVASCDIVMPVLFEPISNGHACEIFDMFAFLTYMAGQCYAVVGKLVVLNIASGAQYFLGDGILPSEFHKVTLYEIVERL